MWSQAAFSAGTLFCEKHEKMEALRSELWRDNVGALVPMEA